MEAKAAEPVVDELSVVEVAKADDRVRAAYRMLRETVMVSPTPNSEEGAPPTLEFVDGGLVGMYGKRMP